MIHSGFLALSRRYRRSLLIGCAAIGLPGIAWSQAVLESEPPEEEEEEIRRYTVEMIVFEYAASAVSGNEIFEPDELPEIEDLFAMPPAYYAIPAPMSMQTYRSPLTRQKSTMKTRWNLYCRKNRKRNRSLKNFRVISCIRSLKC